MYASWACAHTGSPFPAGEGLLRVRLIPEATLSFGGGGLGYIHSAHGLLLALSSGVTSGGAQGTTYNGRDGTEVKHLQGKSLRFFLFPVKYLLSGIGQ